MYLSVCLNGCQCTTNVPGAPGVQVRVLKPLELELLLVLGFPRRAASALNCRAAAPAPYSWSVFFSIVCGYKVSMNIELVGVGH